jgi:hypothetical protein
MFTVEFGAFDEENVGVGGPPDTVDHVPDPPEGIGLPVSDAELPQTCDGAVALTEKVVVVKVTLLVTDDDGQGALLTVHFKS